MFKDVKIWWVSAAALAVLTAVVYVTFFDGGSSQNPVPEGARPEVYVTEGRLTSHGPASLSMRVNGITVPTDGRAPYYGEKTKVALVNPSTVYVKVRNRGQSNQSYTQIEKDDIQPGSTILVYSQTDPNEGDTVEVNRVEINE